jgi:peptide/nickel transport system ATP-binding protein
VISGVESASEVLLNVQELTRSFDIRSGPLRRVVHSFNAVEDVSFTVRKGEALGVVGESGCGKSTLARMLVTAMRPTSGRIVLQGENGPVDLATLDRGGLRATRRRIQMVFQDPFSSLNPRMTVAQIVGDPLYVNKGLTGRALRREVGDVLELVGLNPRLMDRFPHAFSGGQRQRIGLARALVLKPDIIVADEPVSALDVSVQAQILNLLERLQGELGLTYVFISHDLGVVQHLCDRLIVMYSGRLVEIGGTDTLFVRPAHPYVETLIDAAPTLDPGALRARSLTPGEIADPASRPPGCAFHPRCTHADDTCRTVRPNLESFGQDGRLVACHHASQMRLRGVGDDMDRVLVE